MSHSDNPAAAATIAWLSSHKFAAGVPFVFSIDGVQAEGTSYSAAGDVTLITLYDVTPDLRVQTFGHKATAAVLLGYRQLDVEKALFCYDDRRPHPQGIPRAVYCWRASPTSDGFKVADGGVIHRDVFYGALHIPTPPPDPSLPAA